MPGTKARPGVARTASGYVGSRIEVDGAVVADASGTVEDVEALLEFAVGRKGGLR